MVFMYKAKEANGLQNLNGIKIGNRFFGRVARLHDGEAMKDQHGKTARKFSFFHKITDKPELAQETAAKQSKTPYFRKAIKYALVFASGLAIGYFIRNYNPENEMAEKANVPSVTVSYNKPARLAHGANKILPSPFQKRFVQVEEQNIVKINVPSDTTKVASIDTSKGIVYLTPKDTSGTQTLPSHAVVAERKETQIEVVAKQPSYTEDEVNAVLQWVRQDLQQRYGVFGLKYGQGTDFKEDKDFSGEISYMLNDRTVVVVKGGTRSESFNILNDPERIRRKGRMVDGRIGIVSKVYEATILGNTFGINLGLSGHYSTGFTGDKLNSVLSSNLEEFGMRADLFGQYNLSESTILQGGIIVSGSNLQRVLDKTIGTGVITKLKTPAGDIYPSLGMSVTLPTQDTKLGIDRTFTGIVNTGLTLRNGQFGFGVSNSVYFEKDGHSHGFNPGVWTSVTLGKK